MRCFLALVLVCALGVASPSPARHAVPLRSGVADAGADFNGDGFADLAVGVFQEDVGSAVDAGGVEILYGSAGQLQADAPDDQFWTQDSPGVQDQAESGDEFGRSFATGDFDRDGYQDLAIGAFGEDVGTARNAGAVEVLYGSPDGLQADAPDDQLWTQDSPGVQDQAQAGDWFGWSVAAGDLNGDGFADLSIGSRLEDISGQRDAGAINVLYGTAAGLQASGPDDQFWTQDSPGVQDQVERGDEYGWFLVTGRFDGDAFADLAVGAHTEDLAGAPNAGAVNVLYGSPAGLQADAPDDQFWIQGSSGVQDGAEAFDEFGRTEVAADFNADGYGDLAIRVLGEDIPGVVDAGAVSVLYGSAAGLQADAPDDQFWTQDSPGVEEQAEPHDAFAHALAGSDFNGDGFADLAMGTPAEDLDGSAPNSIVGAGAMNVLYGGPFGLQADAPQDQFWSQDSPSVKDFAENGDRFGHILATGDFDGDGFADVGIGVPSEGAGGVNGAGAMDVLYGSPSGLQAIAPDDQAWGQDTPGVQDQAEEQDQLGRAAGPGS